MTKQARRETPSHPNGLFLHPQELPSWKKQDRGTGGLTFAEKAAKFITKAYEVLYGAFCELQGRYDAEVEARQAAEQRAIALEARNGELTKVVGDLAFRTQFESVVMVQLAAMMPDSEMLPRMTWAPKDHEGRLFENSYATYRVEYSADGNHQLKVTPKQGRLESRLFSLDQYGIDGPTNSDIAGFLGLSGKSRFTHRARIAFQKKSSAQRANPSEVPPGRLIQKHGGGRLTEEVLESRLRERHVPASERYNVYIVPLNPLGSRYLYPENIGNNQIPNDGDGGF